MSQFVTRRMIVEKETPTNTIQVHARIKNMVTGTLYAIIRDAMGNEFIKSFEFIQGDDLLVIEFGDELPAGFFYPGREFDFEVRDQINGASLQLELVSTAKTIHVKSTDDTDADGEPQTIGGAF